MGKLLAGKEGFPKAPAPGTSPPVVTFRKPQGVSSPAAPLPLLGGKSRRRGQGKTPAAVYPCLASRATSRIIWLV